MNDTQLNCFLAVAQTLSFARAAEQLHISQPAVTRQIHTLEKELGVQLLRRTTRTVRLTQAGQGFLYDANRIVSITQAARQRLAQAATRQMRVLSVSCPGWAQLFRLSGPLRALCTEYPGVRPRLQVLPAAMVIRLLEEGELDAALTFRLEKEGHARYKALCRVPLYCLFPPDIPLPEASALTAQQLRDYPLVTLEPRRGDVADWATQLTAGRGVETLYLATSHEEALTLVEAGLGVTVLPGLYVPPHMSARCIPLAGAPAASFGVYTRAEPADSPLRRFLALLGQVDWMDAAQQPEQWVKQ